MIESLSFASGSYHNLGHYFYIKQLLIGIFVVNLYALIGELGECYLDCLEPKNNFTSEILELLKKLKFQNRAKYYFIWCYLISYGIKTDISLLK